MNVLDWVLVAIALAYAFSGYWQGFIAGAFATTGLLSGVVLGFRLAPVLLEGVGDSMWVALGALLVVLVCASLGQAVLQFFGTRVREWVTWQPARALDAVGGAALGTAAVLAVAWALGVAVTGSSLPVVSEQARSSAVLQRVDKVMPSQADRLLQEFNDVVGSKFFPQYLEPFAPETIVEVGPPPGRIGRDPEVRQAGASVLKVRGDSECGRGVEGTGFLYQPNRVMTNAHVVAGVDNPTVLVGGTELTGRVVYYDPAVDIAVLAVDDVNRPFLSFDRDGVTRQAAAVLGYPNDGPYDVQPARIRAEQRLRGPDIYGNGAVVRDVYSVRGLVRPGNSGGPLVSKDGEVLGVIFAASLREQPTGYALTAEQVAEGASQGVANRAPVDTGRCTQS